jgi:hypothetical protein
MAPAGKTLLRKPKRISPNDRMHAGRVEARWKVDSFGWYTQGRGWRGDFELRAGFFFNMKRMDNSDLTQLWTRTMRASFRFDDLREGRCFLGWKWILVMTARRFVFFFCMYIPTFLIDNVMNPWRIKLFTPCDKRFMGFPRIKVLNRKTIEWILQVIIREPFF